MPFLRAIGDELTSRLRPKDADRRNRFQGFNSRLK